MQSADYDEGECAAFVVELGIGWENRAGNILNTVSPIHARLTRLLPALPAVRTTR